MVVVRMRYVTSRRNRDGTLRWYWQRPGFPMTRLPDAEPARVRAAFRLNEQADHGQSAAHGTMAWAIDEYTGSPAYRDKASETKRIYDRWLAVIRKKWGAFRVTEIQRSEILDAVKTVGGIPTQRHFVAVLQNIFKVAIDHNYLAANPASEIDLGKRVRRRQIWADDRVLLWLETARQHPEAEGLIKGFALLLFTAQRPCDVLRDGRKTTGMLWPQYNGLRIMVRQQKTGRLVSIPCHSSLKAILDNPRGIAGPMVTNRHGRAMTYSHWSRAFREVCERAGIEDLQARDLRRTACVHLTEVGCSTRLVASISGHSEQALVAIIETYVPATEEMARQAMAAWETKGRTFGL